MNKPLDQTATPLLSTLQACARRNYAPFHTPGHRRGNGAPSLLIDLLGRQALQADLPELSELDNLFAPQGIIREAQDLAAAAFGADQTWFLANGSTSGIIAAILATCRPGEKIILPRNIHYSVISGLILSGAVPIFVQPEYDATLNIAHSISPAAVTAALTQHADARAVMMVHPTYYGVCGDVEKIAHLCHQHALPLLVDEAHGAHFAFHPELPTAALASGADLVVQSTHKTLAALTQAAMLHVQGTQIDRDRLTYSLALVQSTSPNYLLLASLDAARHQMTTQGREQLEKSLKLADRAIAQIQMIPGLATLDPAQANTPGFVALDRTRLTVTVSGLGMDGFTADQILNQRFGVVAELPSLQHLTFILTHGNSEQDVDRLVSAFRQLAQESAAISLPLPPPPSSSSPILSPREAFFAPAEVLPLAHGINRISAELICPYPPGIPVLLPGELVTPAAIAYLQAILNAGGTLSGCTDPTLQTLKVIRS